ncbi:hypothetical protein DPMN_117267 [Dreissena polymorpha]|uniref:Uncharacterized protein n=1 Tax=Dreissena polymorpha TaxID=45954 RepID=A0A9D4QV16_DREPO|nr:hypothetical protein DPMN_117267 [Dreissena polymorpha]
MIRTYKALSKSDADMDANDFFIIRHASDVSRLLKESHLDQTILDLLKEEGFKHVPPIRTNRIGANPITQDGSGLQKSKQTKLGKNVGAASSSQEAETVVDQAHTGRKHVTNQGKHCSFIFRCIFCHYICQMI